MNTTEKGRIVSGSAGSFLDPPSYPTHEYAVETDLRRRPENRGSMGLVYAAECDYLDPATRAEAKRLLDAWPRPALDSPETRDWVEQVLGYFRNCYRGPGDGPEVWHAGNLSIEPDTDPVLNADLHAGVRHVRKFYPEFTPTGDDFERAYWGQKGTT